MAEKLHQRLLELVAADSLGDVPRVPPPRCHELTGDLKGKLAVDLVHPYRDNHGYEIKAAIRV